MCLSVQETIRELARYRAVIANRVLLELGLRAYHQHCMKKGKFIFTQTWTHFLEHHLQYHKGKGNVRDTVWESIQALECDTCWDSVKRELDGLVHNVSVPHHEVLDTDDSGLCIGGKHRSQGCTVAIVMLCLQQLGCFTEDVRYLDENGQDLFLLSAGQVLQPI